MYWIGPSAPESGSEEPNLEERTMQFLYATGDAYTFMDTESFEQLTFDKGKLGQNADLLKENMIVKILCTSIAQSTSNYPTLSTEVSDTDRISRRHSHGRHEARNR